MNHIGIDLHKWESQICIVAEGGELIDGDTPLHHAQLAGCGPISASCALHSWRLSYYLGARWDSLRIRSQMALRKH